jgi:glycerophosphoryl diester phosphodiesterase
MLNTIKISNKKSTKFIAHRGLSGLELENTISAFVAAGNRSYIGIETDVHVTKDGKFVVYHDDTTGRLCDEDVKIGDTDYKKLKLLTLKPQKNRTVGSDFVIPDLRDYLSICAFYDKIAVLELKERMTPEHIAQIYAEVEKYYNPENLIFISFSLQNLIDLRQLQPNANIQYLVQEFNKDILATLKQYNFDLDIGYWVCSKEVIDTCHENGIKVNCWTVDNLGDAERLIDYGVDYITSNILE